MFFCVELAHAVAIDEVDVAVFARSNDQVLDRAGAVHQVRQQHFAAGTEILVGHRFGHLVGHREVVWDSERAARSRDLDEGIAEVTLVPKAVRILSRLEAAVAGEEVYVSGRIGPGPSPLIQMAGPLTLQLFPPLTATPLFGATFRTEADASIFSLKEMIQPL
jgi:hypothetical protein